MNRNYKGLSEETKLQILKNAFVDATISGGKLVLRRFDGTGENAGSVGGGSMSPAELSDAMTEVATDETSTFAQQQSAAFVGRNPRGEITDVRAMSRRGAPGRVLSLVTGGEDESTPAVSNCTVSTDTTNFRVGTRGWKMSMAGAVTAFIEMNPISPAAAGQTIAFPPAQAVCAWVYISDAAQINYMALYLFLGATGAENWNRATTADPAQTLVNGWNLIRFKTADALALKAQWGTLQKVRVYAATLGPVDVTVGHMYLECPEKARMIFCLDRGYKTFVTAGGVDDLRALGAPITWALDPTYLGYATGTGDKTEVITEADLATYVAQGDSASFHSYDGSPTSALTDAQLRADALKAVKWLQARGYSGRMWRAAYVQNSAPNFTAVQDLVLAQAMSTVHAVNYGSWPPIQMHNIERFGLEGQSNAAIDTMFSDMQKSHGLVIPFVHGIHPDGTLNGGHDVTPDQWVYFTSKLSAALDAGWMEATTFEALWLESGGSFGNIGGEQVATYTDAAGDVVTKRIL